MDRDLSKLIDSTRSDPENIDAWRALLFGLNIRNQESLCSEYAREAIKKFPDDPYLWYEYILSISYIPEELEKCRKAMKELPKNSFWALSILAWVSYLLDDKEEARKILKQIPEESRNDLYFEGLGNFYASELSYSDAIIAYKKALALNKKNIRAIRLIARAYRHLGRTDDSIKWALRVIHGEPRFVKAWGDLTKAYLEKGDLKLAMQSSASALSANPLSWRIYFLWADYYLTIGKFDLAIAENERLLLLDPDSLIVAEAHNYIGYANYLKGNLTLARNNYLRAIELNSSLAVAWLNLGILESHESHTEEAIGCYKKAIECDSMQSWAFTQLGLAYLDSNELKGAYKAFNKAIELEPSEYWAYLGLSDYFRIIKNPHKQLETAQMALKEEPEDTDVRNYLGIAYECNGKLIDAEREYKMALAFDPYNRWAANNLGFLCERLTKHYPEYKTRAVEAWKVRLLICRDTQASVRGAIQHLTKLGIPTKLINQWLKKEIYPYPDYGKEK